MEVGIKDHATNLQSSQRSLQLALQSQTALFLTLDQEMDWVEIT
jgi:hypothetical protein